MEIIELAYPDMQAQPLHLSMCDRVDTGVPSTKFTNTLWTPKCGQTRAVYRFAVTMHSGERLLGVSSAYRHSGLCGHSQAVLRCPVSSAACRRRQQEASGESGQLSEPATLSPIRVSYWTTAVFDNAYRCSPSRPA